VPARRDFDLTQFQTGEFAGDARQSRRRMARMAQTTRRKIQETFWKVKKRQSERVKKFCRFLFRFGIGKKKTALTGKFYFFFLTLSLFHFKLVNNRFIAYISKA
jgi:hypothetical protein